MTTDEWDLERLKEIRKLIYTMFPDWTPNDITEDIVAQYVLAYVMLQTKEHH